ncbi:MAG: FtsW/RodA/SpoVE family cell cycle protein [Bacteroidales bacterium]|nr:FtsW/RodA/SpoVE family cell cycle protein [Bacteroidales bacterium]
MSKILRNIRGDKVIWAVVILLSIFSLLTVYSSTGTLAYKYQSGNTEYYMMKHFIILLFGFLIMYLTHLIKFTYFSRIFQIALYIAVPLLILTLFIGLDLNEAKRVLPLPFNLTFQTSDLAKLTLILYLARLLSKKQENIKDFKSAFMPLMIPVLIVCGLILPANFSTAAMLFVTSLVLMFIGRVNLVYIFSLVGIGIVSFILLLLIAGANPELLPRQNTWKTRVVSFFQDEKNVDSDKNYQVEQAKIAIAEGGLIGKFPGNSTQRNFLPHPYSDFIFAIFIEECGLAGGAFLVLLYLILFYRVVRIVSRIPRNFGAFMAIGLGFSLVFQAMINMAVAVNLIPVTGQPLPLISMGGTSIWFTSISLGVILSISKEIDTTPENIEEYVTA